MIFTFCVEIDCKIVYNEIEKTVDNSVFRTTVRTERRLKNESRRTFYKCNYGFRK